MFLSSLLLLSSSKSLPFVVGLCCVVSRLFRPLIGHSLRNDSTSNGAALAIAISAVAAFTSFPRFFRSTPGAYVNVDATAATVAATASKDR